MYPSNAWELDFHRDHVQESELRNTGGKDQTCCGWISGYFWWGKAQMTRRPLVLRMRGVEVVVEVEVPREGRVVYLDSVLGVGDVLCDFYVLPRTDRY